MDVLKVWFILSAVGLLILMALELVPWNRGMELLAKLVECFVMGQGMCDRNVLFSRNGIFPDMEA